MILKKFIKQTLVDIHDAINQASDEIGSYSMTNVNSSSSYEIKKISGDEIIVEFDLSVGSNVYNNDDVPCVSSSMVTANGVPNNRIKFSIKMEGVPENK